MERLNVMKEKENAYTATVEERRSSILKQQKHRSPLSTVAVDDEQADNTIAKQNRRVSFASSNYVKQFTTHPEANTIWDSTYEESVSQAVDSSSASSNIDTKSNSCMELTQCLPGKQQECRRGTIYFNCGEDIEIDTEAFVSLPPELAIDKENLLVKKRKRDETVDSCLIKKKEANTSNMEFTEVISEKSDIMKQVVMYRNIEEITMMESVKGDADEKMEFTECVQMEDLIKSFDENDKVPNETGIFGINCEETACIGRIFKSTGLNANETTDCINEDTQVLINCNLSGSSKTKLHSEYSKILAAEDYNPPSVNSKIMALCDQSTINCSEHYVSIPAQPLNDSDITELSKKDADCFNISQENMLDISSLNSSVCSNISRENVPEVENDYIKKELEKLIQFKPKETKFKHQNIQELCVKLKSLYKENIKIIEEQSRKSIENCNIHTEENESSSTLQNSEMDLGISNDSVSDTTAKKEENLSIMHQIKEKAKQSKHFWKITMQSEGKCVVSSLYGASKSIVEFDHTNGKIGNIVTTVHIKPDAEPIAKYVMKQFDRKLSPEMLISSLGQNFDILSFLDYVQMTFRHAVKLHDEHDALVREYGFEMHEDMRVTFTIISKEQKIVWDVEVNFAHELLNEDSVKVRAVLGNVNERAVKKCIKGCPQGFAVFTPFATNIKNYVNSLRRPVNN